MRTLGLDEAAAFVRLHPHTLEAKARSGDVPACKPGKEWVFIDVDLAEWLRGQYKSNQEEKPCPSTVEVASGGPSGKSAADALRKALEQPTGRRRRSGTTAAVLPFGTRSG